MINEDKSHHNHILNLVTDENKQKELLIQDEEEDFLDEGLCVLNRFVLKLITIF